jgi:hypothetical protein
MAQSITFDFRSTNLGPYQTAEVTVSAGDFARVRFDRRTGQTEVFLHITANGKETLEPITDYSSWASGGLMSGDVVKLSAKLNGSAQVTGILEVGA